MAFEPYLSERNLGCYKDAMCAPSPPDPNCTMDPYKKLFKDRWDVLRTDPCQRSPLADLTVPCAELNNSLKTLDQVCSPPAWRKMSTLYQKDYDYPKSHNNVDDCCKTPCPCVDKFPELPSNVAYRCTAPSPCPPLDDRTTYRSFYVPHCVQPRWRKEPEVWDPCEGPMENCTITSTDFVQKNRIPIGPANSEIIKHGMWSCSQFCKEFTDETTTGTVHDKKCAPRRRPFCAFTNLTIPKCGMRNDTTTRVDFPPKEGEDVCYPEWISNDIWYKPETALEKCTTYNHFYKPHPIPTPLNTLKVRSAGAIPFCTLNKLCYSCHDPEPQQKTPVEMKDNDPWPVAVREPIKYQDNLQTDPCAPFCDETITRNDYTPKALCRPNENFAPIQGYVPPLIPFNDNTTNRMDYRAYNWNEYQNAIGNAGNPNGVDWGPYYCGKNVDACLPRFPAPYGHPLKPYLNKRCPCGPFDNRSTYNQDFRFRSAEVLQEMENEMCRQPNVPKGVSIYRHDFINQGGKKAEVTPPPPSKGYRCIHPCSLRDTDTLYRIDYHDFWKSMDRPNLELYRGKPTIRTRRAMEPQDLYSEAQEEIIYTPVFVRPTKPEPTPNLGPFPRPTVNFQTPEFQRCRDIPFTGQDILNRSCCTKDVCNGYR